MKDQIKAEAMMMSQGLRLMSRWSKVMFCFILLLAVFNFATDWIMGGITCLIFAVAMLRAESMYIYARQVAGMIGRPVFVHNIHVDETVDVKEVANHVTSVATSPQVEYIVNIVSPAEQK